jgi:hypothetical protein
VQRITFAGSAKNRTLVQHVIILSVASKAQIHLRCSAAEKSTPVEGISRTLRGDAQAGGSGEIRVRRIDPRPSTRSLTSELHAQTFPLGTDVRYCRR